MEENFYWMIEYGKVFLGYGILMFLWPMVMFRKFLSGKSVTFRFCFCVTGQVVLINTVVLLLGLLHILNEWTMRVLFYGSFLYSIRDCFVLNNERKTKLKYLVNGTYGWKNFWLVHRRKLIRRIEIGCGRLGRFYKKHWLEYSLLIVALVYALIYFSWGVFHEHSYGFSDMYVHHEWIYQLSEGIPFSNGIYPEGMHCIIYALNSLFGIRIYSCMLFCALANLIALLLAAYCFMKELFQWRYSAVFVLFALLTFGEFGRYIVISYARLQCALPQEFAFPAVFICALYLYRYLKEKKTKRYRDENLLVFALALISTIVVHFYTTFMAFFLCLGVACFCWKRIFSKERFVPLVTAVLLSVLISVVPMGLGYMTGIPLQGSLYWALDVMQNSAQEEGVGESNDSTGIIDESEEKNEVSSEMPEESESVQIGVQEQTQITQDDKSNGIIGKIQSLCSRLWEKIANIAKIIYKEVYLSLYNEAFVKVILLIVIGVFGVGTVGAVLIFFLQRIKKKKIKHLVFAGYFIIIFASLIYILEYSSVFIGIPALLERSRIAFICNLLMMMIAIIPIDIVFGIFRHVLPDFLQHAFSVGIAGGLVACVWLTGCFHGYLYFELTRYDKTVQITNEIIESLPKYSYTIVSSTSELHQVIEYGRHEEVLDFLKQQREVRYFIPTEYVFIFVEKRPLLYAQYLFFDGSKWLGYNKYQELYGKYSTWPEYESGEISADYVTKEMVHYNKASEYYSDIETRTILQSQLYEWCQKFKELYPNEMRVYYEDENFICYYFRQNEQSLYNLNLE